MVRGTEAAPRLGYLTAEKRPGRTRERTHYQLAERGRAALVAWMEEPAAFPRIQHEPVVRALAADLVDPQAVLRSLTALRGELAEISERIDVAEAVAAALPHRERELRLVHGLARDLVRLHAEWLDRVERELGWPSALVRREVQLAAQEPLRDRDVLARVGDRMPHALELLALLGEVLAHPADVLRDLAVPLGSLAELPVLLAHRL